MRYEFGPAVSRRHGCLDRIRALARWFTREGHGGRFPARSCSFFHVGAVRHHWRLRKHSSAIIRHRRDLGHHLHRDRDLGESFVDDRLCSVPAHRGPRTCCSARCAPDDTDQLCFSDCHLVVANDPVAGDGDTSASAAAASWQAHSAVESLFVLGGVAEPDLKARFLLSKFTLNKALVAEWIALESCIGADAAKLLRAVQAIAVAAAAEPLRDYSIISRPDLLGKFLPRLTGHASDERLWALYLNANERLLESRLISCGSPVSADLNIRTIIIGALEVGATALILVHNHPSGDATPSSADVRSTRIVADAARAVEVQLYDHLVVAGPFIRSILRPELDEIWCDGPLREAM